MAEAVRAQGEADAEYERPKMEVNPTKEGLDTRLIKPKSYLPSMRRWRKSWKNREG